MFSGRANLLQRFGDVLDLCTINAQRESALSLLQREHWSPVRELFARLPSAAVLAERGLPQRCDFAGDVLRFGQEGDLSAAEQQVLTEILRLLIPWRKGPFNICGQKIDSEWRSEMKWHRLSPFIRPLSGKRLADVGCSNGYYMFRAALQEPELILGFDPGERYFLQFSLLQRFAQAQRLQCELLGLNALQYFPEFFDVIFCWGVIYHQRQPERVLEILQGALKPGGQLIIESQAIAGDEVRALYIAQRYAKAHNVYYLPTAKGLKSWVEQAGFAEVEIISAVPLTTGEQRRTEFMPFESLADFLDPQNPELTVEGHPAPWRVAVSAIRPG